MPIEIHLPDSDSDTTSLTSSSSKASSLLLYTHRDRQQDNTPTLTHRKSLPLRRLSSWLSRRISKQGLNATYETHSSSPHNYPHAHAAHHNDADAEIISEPTRRKILTFEADYDYDYERQQARRTERELAESYAAYCRAFTSAGQRHYHHKRKTWMMDGPVEIDVDIDMEITSDVGNATRVDAEDDDEGRRVIGDDERETRRTPAEAVPVPELELQLPPKAEAEGEPAPPPHILTPSLYAEMRRAASNKKTRQRQRWLWSWFPHIRHRESH